MMVSFLFEKSETRHLQNHTKAERFISNKIGLYSVKYVTYSLWM